MKVGDLVKVLIVDGHPIGIITKVENSQRWQFLYHVWNENQGVSYPFREHQLEEMK